MNLSDFDIVLLASGLSSRFEDGDKLLANLGERQVIDFVASLPLPQKQSAKLAVAGIHQTARRQRLAAHHWTTIDNPAPEHGQGSALAHACHALIKQPTQRPFMVLLADMPFISIEHLENLSKAYTPDTDAIFTQVGQTLSPPAIFSPNLLKELSYLSGDKGAKSILTQNANIKTVSLNALIAMDIDCVADLSRAQQHLDSM